MPSPLTDTQLDEYAIAAIHADHAGTQMDPAIVTTLVDDVRRLRQQQRFLIDQLRRKGAASGETERRLHEFLTGDTGDTGEDDEPVSA